MTAAPWSDAADPNGWVFAGTDVCREAGVGLPNGARRPMFDDDMWDFTEVVGLPVQMALATRRFDFAAITDPRWRLVAKESWPCSLPGTRRWRRCPALTAPRCT